MFKIRIEQTNKGKTTKNRKNNFKLKFPFQMAKAGRQSRNSLRKVNIEDVFEPLLTEISLNILEDRLNEAPESRKGTLTHFQTGDLFRSIDLRVSGTRSDEVHMDFGYFISYGLNLELGGPRSRSLRNFQILENGASTSETERNTRVYPCLLYTSPSPRDRTRSRMPSSA